MTPFLTVSLAWKKSLLAAISARVAASPGHGQKYPKVRLSLSLRSDAPPSP